MATKYGLTLSSEEHGPRALIDLAVEAERRGFDFVSISDHYHPWITEQGHAPFVWTVLGGIAEATDSIEVGVGVTCPTIRTHPAVIAQAVATAGCLLDGRFTFGVGSGENLNEHVTGAPWPPAPVRIEMLGEAIEVIRALLTGESITHRGTYYEVEDARIFDLPRTRPPLLVSAFGPIAARLAAEQGDGLWITGTASEAVDRFRDSGGDGPIWTQLSFCWDPDEDAAIDRALRVWPNTAIPGQLSQDLRTIAHFELASELVTRDVIADSLPCGPDVSPVIDGIRKARSIGADHIYLHQVGDPRDGFLDVWESEIRPELD